MADVCTQGVDTGFVALGYAKIALLGVVQGLTELLPVSSTAHMRLVPALLGWQDPGSAFSAAMQLAALAAIISYFWSDVRYVAFGSVDAIRQRDWRSPAIRLAIAIVIATIPIGIAGLLLSSSLNACGTSLRSLWVIGIACLVMGLLLAAAELYSRHRKDMEQMTLLDALFVGITQAGALIPGVSRSGSTLTGALFLGLKRDEAARFSFLLGLPAIALAGLKELLTLYKAHIPMEAWSVLIVGLIVGCISSFVAIWGLMRFLERFSTWPFVIYRVVLGVVILFGVFALGWS
ncbi:undecaprenyl-diphosphate phosphatase [Agrobacterium sp. SHOUNA12C]|uniref:undecaprenyl-diphosphate phosphatase n=1 Tax=Rhizobium rhizogenes TaxID=359 RepID=UPI0012384D94|nr:undecaprenyl-diphosphate phosphatase [Rhizobium rhizogenes]KAA6488507.1 undecaprenyl-diphosphate phosphatase [Agrobacterium sp. ICMP 7243]MCJ9721798.1 undecaprenyl-diphosphate phosphatase [Agrobacterium sp. BETTINA12B]MCJ9756496.1 undecaprenyl-diphosphate phosphatase [Agrobacterium sp. SHOUNA12C]NTF52119.1 undecaprenyl-diphosphate phosphatase [Rhizobium rhizogenes]NTG17663.1 undecaprenyl-diphosphate phosphatase [Rhizobium rhizogenes]